MPSATTSEQAPRRNVKAALSALIGERAVARLEEAAGADVADVLERLLVLKTDGFYGKLTLTFERGVVKHGKREESFKVK